MKCLLNSRRELSDCEACRAFAIGSWITLVLLSFALVVVVTL